MEKSKWRNQTGGSWEKGEEKQREMKRVEKNACFNNPIKALRLHFCLEFRMLDDTNASGGSF